MQHIAVVLAAVVLAAGSSVNYCGSRMCGNTNAHTFCQFPEGPSPNCVGYISARLTIEEKSRIIARLNRRRNEAAAGSMRGLPSAGNMLKLRWVEELAREAQRWADQCRPPRTIEEHDVCRNLYSLTVGQCVASVVGEAPGLRIESMVDIWYMQSMLYKGNVTFYVPPNQNTGFYGDFAQIMWAQSYMVGCGRSRFMTNWQGRLRSVERLVCNIAPHGPTPTRPLWAPAGPATMCPSRSRRDTVMPALCDYQRDPKEITVIDSSMTLENHLLLNTVLEIESNKTLDYLGSLDQIYLTKLAIATMENTVTEPIHYNSMQRRDVIEAIDMRDQQNDVSTAILPYEVIPAPNTTLAPENTTITTLRKTTKKKMNLVGRPRTYNMEDLTDFDEKTENNTPIEIPQRQKEFYAEYEFLEPDDRTTTTDLTNSTEGPDIVNIVINQDVLRDVVTGYNQNASLYGPINSLLENAMLRNDISSLNESASTPVVGNSSLTNDNIDDYLSDPETVRELQEALDRIENDMAPKRERQGKVRRELRDFPEEPIPTKPKSETEQALLNAEIERNKTRERGPMLNMVLKYMPYLKQYEGSILPKMDESSSSIDCSVSPLLILVVNVFVIV